jgi:hypothetical protein
MSNSVYIDRLDEDGNQADEGILPEEWVAAIQKIDGIRLAGKDQYGNSELDVEVYVDTMDKWYRAINWDGSNASFDVGFICEPVFMRKVFEIASLLNASILSQNGENWTKKDFPEAFENDK